MNTEREEMKAAYPELLADYAAHVGGEDKIDVHEFQEFAEAYDKHGEPWLLYADNVHYTCASVEEFLETYEGEYESVEDYAREFVQNCYNLKDVPQLILDNIYYAGIWRDLSHGDYWSTRMSNGRWAIFSA